MKDVIQQIMSGITSPSEASYISSIFNKYSKFMIAKTGVKPAGSPIDLLFYDGDPSDIHLNEEGDHHQFVRNIDLIKFDVVTMESDTVDTGIPIYGEWYQCSDFTLPSIKIPTLADLLSLPTLEIINGPSDFLEDGLSTFMTCSEYDIDRCMLADFDDRIRFELIASKTTDYYKYGMTVYRAIIDDTVVGVFAKHGRYLDSIDMHLTEVDVVKKLAEDIQSHCTTSDTGYLAYSRNLDDEVSWLEGDILDALYEGKSINHNEY